ncbi:MAG: hypothetical protein LH469_13000 [Frankiaceae bacterium]|nr:hypothetical protein [Frankiaceae bacterium]
MGSDVPDALDRARRDSGLTGPELWMRYFALGGTTGPLQLEAVLHGALVPGNQDHDQIAHALNERFTELGRNHPVPYRSAGTS